MPAAKAGRQSGCGYQVGGKQGQPHAPHLATEEVARLPPFLADGPRQASLDRRDGLVQVVACAQAARCISRVSTHTIGYGEEAAADGLNQTRKMKLIKPGLPLPCT